MTDSLKKFIAIAACLVFIPIVAFTALFMPYLAPQIYDRSISHFVGVCPAERSETHTTLQLNGQTLEIPTNLVQTCILYGRKALDDERHIFLSGRLSDYAIQNYHQPDQRTYESQEINVQNPKITMEIQPTNARKVDSGDNFRYRCKNHENTDSRCTISFFQFSKSNSATIDIYPADSDIFDQYRIIIIDFFDKIQ